MSITRRTNNGWEKVNTLRRYTSNGWQNVTTAKIYHDNQWMTAWRESGTFSKTYYPTEYASYNIASTKRVTDITVTNDMPRMVQGSPSNTYGSIISTMIFFPLETIRNDLHDATISNVYLYLKRLSTRDDFPHGYVLIHYGGGFESCPENWDGSDSGDADSGTPYMTPDESKRITLNRAVGEGFRDGSVTFISLNAIGRKEGSCYNEFDASYTRLTINYSV